MSKMITKGVAFNPESKRHMEILKWVEDEQKNFSSYIRELLAIQYEKSKQNQENIEANFNSDIDLSKLV